MMMLNPHGGAGEALPAPREPAFDQLRALAMLVGVLFHAALAYSPLASPVWPTADRQHWVGVDVLIWLPHLVRMPLFFLVAGYFTAALLVRRGMAGLARQRLRRVLLPFLLAWPLVHFSLSASTEWALLHVQQPSEFLRMVQAWLAQADRPHLPPGTGHLWFLPYLLLFSLMVWIGRSLAWSGVLDRWLALDLRAVALGLPLLLLPGFALTSAPHPAPESLLPQLWAIALYGPFFALGFGLYGRLERLALLHVWLWPGLVACLLLYLLFLKQLGLHLRGLAEFGSSPASLHTPIHLALLQAMIAAWATLACLLAGLRWCNRPRGWLRYLAASAYWTYLLHLPVVVAVQYVLMDGAWPWPVKWAATVLITLALCLVSYEFIVRRTRLRAWVG